MEELLAPLLRALLRVVEIRERPHLVLAERAVVEQDACDDERSRERAAPRLVDAGHEPRPELPVESQEPLAGPLHPREDSARLADTAP